MSASAVALCSLLQSSTSPLCSQSRLLLPHLSSPKDDKELTDNPAEMQAPWVAHVIGAFRGDSCPAKGARQCQEAGREPVQRLPISLPCQGCAIIITNSWGGGWARPGAGPSDPGPIRLSCWPI